MRLLYRMYTNLVVPSLSKMVRYVQWRDSCLTKSWFLAFPSSPDEELLETSSLEEKILENTDLLYFDTDHPSSFLIMFRNGKPRAVNVYLKSHNVHNHIRAYCVTYFRVRKLIKLSSMEINRYNDNR